MKIEKSNNPAATGALILVLVLIVGRIVWMLFGQNRPVSAASIVAAPVSPPPAAPVNSPTAAPASAPAAAALPHDARAHIPVTRATARNPFTCSVPVRPRTEPASQSGEARGLGPVPLAPLPPLPVQIGKTGVTAVAPLPSSLPGPGVMPVHPAWEVLAQTGRPLSTEPSPIQSLKLTALVDGGAPMAVVQTANPEPVVLHVGDELAGMRVAAISEQGVIFTRGRDRWTLTLQTAADSSAAGSVSVTPDATPEEKSDEKQ